MFYLTVWLLLNTPIKITSLLSKRDECKFILRQMTNTAMKLKDACFLEEKLWPTSVQFSRSVVSDSCDPMNCMQHARPPCPSQTPRVQPNPCPLNRWCHPAISSSVVPFSSRPQSLPASGSFQMSQFFTLDGQSIGVSASTSVLPMNTLICLYRFAYSGHFRYLQ